MPHVSCRVTFIQGSEQNSKSCVQLAHSCKFGWPCAHAQRAMLTILHCAGDLSILHCAGDHVMKFLSRSLPWHCKREVSLVSMMMSDVPVAFAYLRDCLRGLDPDGTPSLLSAPYFIDLILYALSVGA